MTIHPECCGHGRTWDEDCPACEDVWRKERVKDLHERAARYGFRLVPVKLDENHRRLAAIKTP